MYATLPRCVLGAPSTVNSLVPLRAPSTARLEGELLSKGRDQPPVDRFITPGAKYDNMIDLLRGYDTCLFCLGVSSVGMNEDAYSKITFDLTTYIARELLDLNPKMTFCYISGASTDSTENGKVMWARVKGKTENALLAMPFKKVYMFRPGFIQPMKGIKSKTPLYRILYVIFRPLFFILKHYENIATNTEILGKAMIKAAIEGYEKNILESRDINKIVKQSI